MGIVAIINVVWTFFLELVTKTNTTQTQKVEYSMNVDDFHDNEWAANSRHNLFNLRQSGKLPVIITQLLE